MKFYIVGPTAKGEGVYSLIAETGEFLASHFCSYQAYAKGDLEANRPERQTEWNKRFGTYEVLFIGDDDLPEEVLINRNHEWYEKERQKEAKV